MQEGFYLYNPDSCEWFHHSRESGVWATYWTVKLGDATCYPDSSKASAVAADMPDDIMILEIKAH